MSLNSFFDTLGTEAQFDAWQDSIHQKLIHLKNALPIENKEERLFVGGTIEFLLSLTLLDPNYLANTHYSGENKKLLIEKLKKCNSFYTKFGKR